MNNTLIESYTLCTDGCENGMHNENYIICNRCGSHIHTKIFVIDVEGSGVIEVGSECFKDIMGYKLTKTHEKAINLHSQIISKIEELKDKNNITTEIKLKLKNFGKSDISIEYPIGLWLIPGKLSKTLITAGTDLNLWKTKNNKSIIIKL